MIHSYGSHFTEGGTMDAVLEGGHTKCRLRHTRYARLSNMLVDNILIDLVSKKTGSVSH